MTFRRGKVYYVDMRWRGMRLNLSTRSTKKARADAMERMLVKLHDDDRTDLLGLLAARRITLLDLFRAYEAGELNRLRDGLILPPLRRLVNEWLDGLPAALNRQRRRYAPQTIRRYRVSWSRLLEQLPAHAAVSDVTKGWLLSYRQTRKASPATVNRDMIAVQAFFTWAAERYAFDRPEIPKEFEPKRRMRWLSQDEIRGLRQSSSDEWWPFWATLLHTGMRWGECAGLRGGDVLLHAKRIILHEGTRRLMTGASGRECPIPPALEAELAAHFVRFEIGPEDRLWPFVTGSRDGYDLCRDEWRALCEDAGVKGATIHSLRHTFGVRAAMAGIPQVAIRDLMGHSSIATTERYMSYAPSERLDSYAQAIADVETEARERKAREGARSA